MLSYQQDTDRITFYTGTAWADLVQGGAWNLTYTPTLTQSGAVGKTVTVARYTQIGKLVIGQVSLAVTSTGTGTQPILFGLPTAARTNALVVGSGFVYDASANICYSGVAFCSTTSTAGLVVEAGTGSGFIGATGMTAALASGDSVAAQFTYEAA
jgi:hypothetical protein